LQKSLVDVDVDVGGLKGLHFLFRGCWLLLFVWFWVHRFEVEQYHASRGFKRNAIYVFVEALCINPFSYRRDSFEREQYYNNFMGIQRIPPSRPCLIYKNAGNREMHHESGSPKIVILYIHLNYILSNYILYLLKGYSAAWLSNWFLLAMFH